jgi:non-lysosomal glucosylceramidase
VTALRKRHDGYRRNPWNEVECGHHYARSMASWALLPALSGFRVDVDEKTLRVDPVAIWPGGIFQTLLICQAGWGEYRQEGTGDGARVSLTVLGGNLDGFTLQAAGQRRRIAGGRLEE